MSGHDLGPVLLDICPDLVRVGACVVDQKVEFPVPGQDGYVLARTQVVENVSARS